MTSEDAPAVPTAFEVQDGGRNVRFTGILLSRVSSERAHAPRWTLMELYRTVGDQYIIHRIGKSIVYHSSDCNIASINRLQYGHELRAGTPTREQLGNMTPCNMCIPRPTDPIEQLRFERERHWSGVAETPEAVIDMLHRTDKGTRALPWIAANLLSEASIKDPDLANSYQTQHIS